MYVAHDGTHSAGINHALGDGSAARLAAPLGSDTSNCSDADNRLPTNDSDEAEAGRRREGGGRKKREGCDVCRWRL